MRRSRQRLAAISKTRSLSAAVRGFQDSCTGTEAVWRTAAVHVKVDTGMHRVGLHPPEDAASFVDRVIRAGCDLEGLWTHFARAEEDELTTRRQLELFHRVIRDVRDHGVEPRIVHAANSAATILYPEAHFDLVRIGIALYGLDPGGGLGERAGLRPALSWRSEVSAVRTLPAGELVSYGHRYGVAGGLVATVPVAVATYLANQPAHEMEREQLLQALQRNEWNIARVARKLGLGRPTVYSRMQRYGIERKKVPKTFKRTPVIS